MVETRAAKARRESNAGKKGTDEEGKDVPTPMEVEKTEEEKKAESDALVLAGGYLKKW